MQELEKRIGLLRLLLADIEGKSTQLREMESQYRSQLSRIMDFVVFREGDLANALSLMSEVQTKLDEVVQTATHLSMVGKKAGHELEILVLTKRVADARSQLASLQDRQQELAGRLAAMGGAVPEAAPVQQEQAGDLDDIRAIHEEVEREIVRLNDLITEASELAARTVQTKRDAEE
jgi:chromosome segregation ATPase